MGKKIFCVRAKPQCWWIIKQATSLKTDSNFISQQKLEYFIQKKNHTIQFVGLPLKGGGCFGWKKIVVWIIDGFFVTKYYLFKWKVFFVFYNPILICFFHGELRADPAKVRSIFIDKNIICN